MLATTYLEFGSIQQIFVNTSHSEYGQFIMMIPYYNSHDISSLVLAVMYNVCRICFEN